MTDFDLSEAVEYHYGKFPPQITDYGALIDPLARASAALARYDQMLKGMHSSDILLTPLRSQEAVISSRMEGTISTLDEVLRYEAEHEDDDNKSDMRYRSEAIEVYLYSRALKNAQAQIKDGLDISEWLIRSAHQMLLGFGRGAHQSPGQFKTEQNFLADKARKKILFVPISPEHLTDGIQNMFRFMNDSSVQILIRTAITHLEFEALHPFKDGNGRIGRMLITLMLWKFGAISEPHFYISEYFEIRRDEYINKMRDVSSKNDWMAWIVFFLAALEEQATLNLKKAESIRELYENMKIQFRELLSSQWSTTALDFVFTRPIFRNNIFTGKAGIPAATAHRFTHILINAGLLKTVYPASGRRPAMYSFEPLLSLVRS